MLSSVLLPEPDGPVMASDSPLAISSVMPRSTSTCSAPSTASKRLQTSIRFNSIGGVAIASVLLDRSSLTSVSIRVLRFRTNAYLAQVDLFETQLESGRTRLQLKNRIAA